MKYLKFNKGSLVVFIQHVTSIKFERSYVVISLVGGGLLEIKEPEDIAFLQQLTKEANENV